MSRKSRYHREEIMLGRHQNPHRLYRDKENAMVAGVAAGIANYFGFNRKLVRILFALSMIFVWPLVIYVILALVIPKRPEQLYENAEQESFWRGLSNAPRDVFGDMRFRFRELDQRLQDMETYITSKEFEFDRELNGK